MSFPLVVAKPIDPASLVFSSRLTPGLLLLLLPQGALAGFVSALAFNLWIVGGKFVHGAGKSEKLTLSTDGCLAEDVLLGGAVNGTGLAINGTDYVAFSTTTTTTAGPGDQLIEER